MARHRSSFGRLMGASMTAAIRAAEAQARAQARAQRQAIRQGQLQARQAEKDFKAWERARAAAYVLARADEASELNAHLAQTTAALESLLADTLTSYRPFDLNSLKREPTLPVFDAEGLDRPEPSPVVDTYLPPPLEGLARHWPASKAKHERDTTQAWAAYEAAAGAHRDREMAREKRLAARRTDFEETIRQIRSDADAEHAAIDAYAQAVADGEPAAIVAYIALALQTRPLLHGWPEPPSDDKIAYIPDSRQLVIEFDLPAFDVVPGISAYKYVKSTNQITTTARPLAQRKALYASIVAQETLRTLHVLFWSAADPHIDTVVFNGYVNSIDEGTGQTIRPCLVTLRVTRDVWNQIALERVEPIACLKVLNAAFSKSPAELAPVRPVMELSMVDPRFIDQGDVLSDLDQRPNLMELTPSEFEALIANLFQKMGLETRLTQASRDGGVDCVAYDMTPVLGGKVVIQAKRYKHTVGVSAVRDLYGTMQNEGASKGILVTTSGYGKAAYDFAQNKPLTLLDGPNLLYLLAHHANIEAKIEIPDGWHDPVADVADEA